MSGARSGIGWGAGAKRGGPPKPPSARQNVVCVTGGNELAARLFGDLPLREDQRPFAGALVDDLDNAHAADDRSCAGERPVQGDALLAVDEPHPIDAGIALAHPKARMAKDGAHGRQHLQVLLVDKGQFVLVHRVVTEPDAERVDDAVPGAVGLFPGRDFERHQFVVDDGHSAGSLTPDPMRTRRSIGRAA